MHGEASTFWEHIVSRWVYTKSYNDRKREECMAYVEKWQSVWKRPRHWRQWVRSPPARRQTPHTSLTLTSSAPEHWTHISQAGCLKNRSSDAQGAETPLSPHLVSATGCISRGLDAGVRWACGEEGNIRDGVTGVCLQWLGMWWLWNKWLYEVPTRALDTFWLWWWIFRKERSKEKQAQLFSSSLWLKWFQISEEFVCCSH